MDLLISDKELQEIEAYISQSTSHVLRPHVYNAILQSIISGLSRHRKKQLFMMEDIPISVADFIRGYWAKDDDIA